MSSVAQIISDCRDGRKIARGVTSVTGSVDVEWPAIGK